MGYVGGMKRFVLMLLFLGVINMMGGCRSLPSSTIESGSVPLELLYNQAMDALQAHDYKKAIDYFQHVERDFPFSPWAVRAQMMEAYANFADHEYDTTMNLVERFVKLHPAHPNVAYMHYLKAMCHYVRVYGSGRDQSVLQDAWRDMHYVATTYPHSVYARDAKANIVLLEDYLAGSEMNVGRFYLKKHDMVSALLRFQYVVTHYPKTVHRTEALYRMIEIYTAFGAMDDATIYTSILGHNHPDSFWYQRAYDLIHTAPKLSIAQEPSNPS